MKKRNKSSKTIRSVSSKKGTTELTEEEAAKVTGGDGYLRYNLENTLVSGYSGTTDTPTK